MNDRLINIIDYRMGNAKSVQNALKRINIKSHIVKRADELKNSCAIILPGVGSFKQAIKNLKANSMFEEINYLVHEKNIPYLGICLGMQLITKDSSENQLTKGFGWIDSRVRRIDIEEKYRLPHVGWNNIIKNGESILLSRVENDTNYYFDHSFELVCDISSSISSFFSYGDKRIISSIEQGHIFGTQFHPEKSQLNGLRVLKAFTNFACSR